jgi:hypothetical protein
MDVWRAACPPPPPYSPNTNKHPTPSQALSTPQPQSYSPQRNGEPQQSSGPATDTIYMRTCASGEGHVPPGATAGQERHHAQTCTQPRRPAVGPACVHPQVATGPTEPMPTSNSTLASILVLVTCTGCPYYPRLTCTTATGSESARENAGSRKGGDAERACTTQEAREQARHAIRAHKCGLHRGSGE